MSAPTVDPPPRPEVDEQPENLGGADSWPYPPWLEAAVRWTAALFGAFIMFAAVLTSRGADPIQVLIDAFGATFTDTASLQQILIKATPFALAALAVVIPARAGLVNVGGEGQVLVGAIAAAGVGLWYDQHVKGDALVVVMFLAAAAAGALWSGIAALLRQTVKVNEAISTLLLNYVALDLLLYLIYEPWKDPNGSGQPATRELADRAKLNVFEGSVVNVGLVVAVVGALAVWYLLVKTSWGFQLSVVGGNPEAARRAGMPVALLLMSAMLVGGALAGLAGAIQFSGVEYELRPGLTASIGYIGFLASWLARHRPVPVLIASLAFASITVAGDSMQIDSGLPAATVNVLTGLVLIAVLGWTGTAKRKARA